MKKSLIVFAIAIFLASCSIAGNDSTKNELDLNEIGESISESKRYTKNMVELLKKVENTQRSLENVESIPEKYFNSLKIQDINGNKILFTNFSDKEREIFLELWEEKQAEILANKMGDDPISILSMKGKNDAMEAGMNSQNRDSFSYEKFASKYNEVIKDSNKRLEDFIRKQRENKDPSSRDIYDLNPDSITTLKNNFEKGYVLVGNDIDSLGYSTIGHAAIITENGANIDWSNAMALITTSSWAGFGASDGASSSNGAYWPGSTSGVQREPLSVWTSTDTRSPTIVQIGKAGNLTWVFSWFNLYPVFNAASASERESAASNAISYIGKPYNYFLANKWWIDAFYCSSLVWRSWYNVSTDYDLDDGIFDVWVAPLDIIIADDVNKITSYQNHN